MTYIDDTLNTVYIKKQKKRRRKILVGFIFPAFYFIFREKKHFSNQQSANFSKIKSKF